MWYQHHRVLQLDSLCTGWCFDDGGSARILGVWIGELLICMARDLDHRHFRATIITSVHVPTDGMDVVGGWNVLLHSGVQRCSSRTDCAVHLSICGIVSKAVLHEDPVTNMVIATRLVKDRSLSPTRLRYSLSLTERSVWLGRSQHVFSGRQY